MRYSEALFVVLLVVQAIGQPGCGGGSPTGPAALPSPISPIPSRTEIYANGARLDPASCAGALVKAPLRSTDLPDGPLSGVADSRLQWTPVSPAARVDAYLLNDTIDHRDINCDWVGADPVCPDGLSFDLNPNNNPKVLSYNTKQARISERIFLIYCNRGPGEATISYSLGFTPDM